MAKYVVADCTSAADAQSAVNQLTQKGYPLDSISLIGNDSAVSGLSSLGVNIENDTGYGENDESLWERIKDFFGGDNDIHAYKDVLDSHREDIDSGNILVTIDDRKVPADMRDSVAGLDNGYWYKKESTANAEAPKMPRADTTAKAPEASRANDYNASDDETIRLEEERLNVNKENVESGEVVVSTHVVEENQTINVPVRHEEVVVERRPVASYSEGTGDFGEDSFSIPLWEEKVNVSKQPVVTEEVRIHKNNVQDTQQVSASLRKEELDVDKTGNVVIKDADTSVPPMQ